MPVRTSISKGLLVMSSRSGAAVAAAVLTTAALCACSTGSTGSNAAATSASAPPDCPVTVTDAWVKAVDSGMTAAFGTLSNPSSEQVTITAASSPSTSATELHEVLDSDGEMVMAPKQGGFSVPAGGRLVLESGGEHLMLMDVTEPIKPGDAVPFTLTCANGATTAFTAQAKTYSGADEHYSGGTDTASAGPSAS